jgi:hypothetical protein
MTPPSQPSVRGEGDGGAQNCLLASRDFFPHSSRNYLKSLKGWTSSERTIQAASDIFGAVSPTAVLHPEVTQTCCGRDTYAA